MAGGVTYFPLDVHLEDKVRLIEAEFGLTGFAVVVKLYQKIYGELGYYCEWTKEVALLFGQEVGLGGNAVSEIVSAAVRRGIFHAPLYEKYHILTSLGIQKRYFEIVSRRKAVDVKREYLLFDVAQKYKNVHILAGNVDIFSENADISEQRKEKERKTTTAVVVDENVRAIVAKLESCWCKTVSPYTVEVLYGYLDTMELPVILRAIELSDEQGIRKVSYVKGILQKWQLEGVHKLGDIVETVRKGAERRWRELG